MISIFAHNDLNDMKYLSVSILSLFQDCKWVLFIAFWDILSNCISQFIYEFQSWIQKQKICENQEKVKIYKEKCSPTAGHTHMARICLPICTST